MVLFPACPLWANPALVWASESSPVRQGESLHPPSAPFPMGESPPVLSTRVRPIQTSSTEHQLCAR